MSTEPPSQRERGVIAWMIGNRVTPNLLMVFLLAGGLYMSTQIKKEVFPDHEHFVVTVSVAYPGASPEEIERGIILAIESGIRGIVGIKEVQARAYEGSGWVGAELLTDANKQQAYQDIKQAVDRITTLPKEIERPIVSMSEHYREVLGIELYGDTSERVLREVVEQVRDRLLQDERITQVDLRGAREQQIHVEVPQQSLRRYGLTLQKISDRIREASVEIPGGKIKTSGGEILLRVKDRRDWAREFANIPIITTGDGTVLRLHDIASVVEGFEETDRITTYDGKPSMQIAVHRVGEQTPIGVSEAARQVMAEIESDLPPGVEWHISRDRSDIYKQRLQLLLKNAFLGLILVLLLLGTFLELRLAFWVTMGIPISFLGGILFLPSMGISINIMSMFAFIIALGIVVDDAIVAGENIYEFRQQGMSFVSAAIRGARMVATPIAFSIITNIIAFLPLYAIEGTMGQVWKAVPVVVITVFAISWLESMIILPSHLAHSRAADTVGAVANFHRRVADLLQSFIAHRYAPMLDRCLRWRYVTTSVFAAVLIIVIGYVFGGRIGLILMPRIESDTAVATAVLPFGSPIERVKEVRDRLVGAVAEVARENGGETLVEGIFTQIEESEISVMAQLTEPGVRPINTGQVTDLWRAAAGEIPGLELVRFESDRGGPGSGAALTIELSHRDIGVLERASAALATGLAEFPNVTDIDDGYAAGKQQLNFRIRERGLSLGLTSSEIGRQVRNAFYGAQAARQQRSRNEVRVLVRLPTLERQSEFDIENMMIEAPGGHSVPLRQVADVVRGRAYTVINRREARRIVNVTANVQPIGQTEQVRATLDGVLLPRLASDFPGLTYGYAGRQQHMKESLEGLGTNFILALLAIYFLLAIPFRSYVQPLAVMIAIPFGIVGATLGHVLMGYNLSLQSMMGMVALSGVVVNDSLLLIDYANRKRGDGLSMARAIREAGIRRFRPVLLTTLTTFGGLAPMIFETSRQARFMIPMALSLGFGILFATVVTLFLVPSLYVIVEDCARLIGTVARSGMASITPTRRA